MTCALWQAPAKADRSVCSGCPAEQRSVPAVDDHSPGLLRIGEHRLTPGRSSPSRGSVPAGLPPAVRKREAACARGEAWSAALRGHAGRSAQSGASNRGQVLGVVAPRRCAGQTQRDRVFSRHRIGTFRCHKAAAHLPVQPATAARSRSWRSTTLSGQRRKPVLQVSAGIRRRTWLTGTAYQGPERAAARRILAHSLLNARESTGAAR